MNKIKQQLEGELKNTPTGTSLACSSVSSALNKLETASEQNKVLTSNNSEENFRQHRGGSDLRILNNVYVLNLRGKPLMPTNQSKARKLIRAGKAKVIRRIPFTIQMLVATGENKQQVILGVDTGYRFIGVSAVSVQDSDGNKFDIGIKKIGRVFHVKGFVWN